MGRNPDRRAEMCSELDGFLTHKYGLTRDDLRYVLDPADIRTPDYPSEAFLGLSDKEILQFGDTTA